MKKILLSSTLALGLLAATPSHAKWFDDRGGYTGPTAASIVTVADAKTMSDDAVVTIKGKIDQHLKKDKYLFNDGTGTIVVEIDHDEWKGLKIGPTDTVQITGEIDKEWFRDAKIDVDAIDIVKTK